MRAERQQTSHRLDAYRYSDYQAQMTIQRELAQIHNRAFVDPDDVALGFRDVEPESVTKNVTLLERTILDRNNGTLELFTDGESYFLNINNVISIKYDNAGDAYTSLDLLTRGKAMTT
jgi:hypothetical protein